MRLTTLRRLFAHLLLALAFGSMAHGGELPGVALPAFGLAWVASAAWGGRIGRGRGRILLAVTFAVLLVVVGFWLAHAYDFVVAAALVAEAVAINRMLARQSAADDGLLYLSALMMLAAGAALSGDLAYGLFFAGFSIAATFALALSHLERAAEEADAPQSAVRLLASRRILAALGVLSVFGLFGALVTFFAFPRFTSGFLAPALAHSRAVAGFSDRIRLGGYGTIKDDPRVVAHLEFDPDPGAESLELRWRGMAFDRFDGHVWSSTTRPLSGPSRRLFVGQVGQAGPQTVQVEILPEGGAPVAFLPEGTVEVAMPSRVPARYGAPQLFLREDPLGNVLLEPVPDLGYRYQVRLDTPGTVPRGLGTDYPAVIRERFLAVPPDLDPRVGQLARRWTAGLTDPLEMARAIERQLSSQYSYTIELPGESSDPLATFLFDRRAGHCEYFATAMTVLLRAVGVPARNATGYYGGQRSGAGTYLLRAGDAHAWTEVFFPGRGFVAFDATPSADRGSSASSFGESWADFLDQARALWLRIVVDYSLHQQVEGVAGFGASLARLGGSGKGRTPRDSIAAFLVLGAALYLSRRLWRAAGPRRRVAVSATSRESVLLYRALLARLSRRGLAKRPGQTPREFAAELSRAGRGEAKVASEVTERYLAARFGAIPLPPAEVRRLRQAVRGL